MNIHSVCIFLLYIFCVIFHLFFHIIIVVYIFEYNFVHCWFFFVFSFHNIQFFYTFIMLTYYCCYIVVLFLFIECFFVVCLSVCPVSQCLFMFLFSHNFAAKRLTTVFISCRRIYTAFYTRMSFKFIKNLQTFLNIIVIIVMDFSTKFKFISTSSLARITAASFVVTNI